MHPIRQDCPISDTWQVKDRIGRLVPAGQILEPFSLCQAHVFSFLLRQSLPCSRLGSTEPAATTSLVRCWSPIPFHVPIPITSHFDQCCLCRHCSTSHCFSLSVFQRVERLAIMSLTRKVSLPQALQAPSNHFTYGLASCRPSIVFRLQAAYGKPFSLGLFTARQIQTPYI